MMYMVLANAELWVNAIEKNVEVFWSEEGLRYAVGE